MFDFGCDEGTSFGRRVGYRCGPHTGVPEIGPHRYPARRQPLRADQQRLQRLARLDAPRQPGLPGEQIGRQVGMMLTSQTQLPCQFPAGAAIQRQARLAQLQLPGRLQRQPITLQLALG